MANETFNRPVDSTANRDPLTGAPGAHPVGTGIGAVAGGMAAGAAAGTVAGPVGTAVGAAVGAVVGGLAGKGIAESIDPTVEDAYWRDNYAAGPMSTGGASYDDFGPAYALRREHATSPMPAARMGHGRARASRDWERDARQVEPEWDRAKHAMRDAWNRVSDSVERAVPGDSDRDGK